MTILGIDPGTSRVGYGIIGDNFEYGVIESNKKTSSAKLLDIYLELEKIILKYNPTELAIERLFFNKNAKTVMDVSEARGVILLLAEKYNLNIKSYTPLEVKQGITSYGKASKQDVQFMVKVVLNLNEVPKPDDAADALALALVHKNFLENESILRN